MEPLKSRLDKPIAKKNNELFETIKNEGSKEVAIDVDELSKGTLS